ncbi:MAG: hypothetical protein AB7P04_09435 [Bacteriovoracia bacterium]
MKPLLFVVYAFLIVASPIATTVFPHASADEITARPYAAVMGAYDSNFYAGNLNLTDQGQALVDTYCRGTAPVGSNQSDLLLYQTHLEFEAIQKMDALPKENPYTPLVQCVFANIISHLVSVTGWEHFEVLPAGEAFAPKLIKSGLIEPTKLKAFAQGIAQYLKQNPENADSLFEIHAVFVREGKVPNWISLRRKLGAGTNKLFSVKDLWEPHEVKKTIFALFHQFALSPEGEAQFLRLHPAVKELVPVWMTHQRDLSRGDHGIEIGATDGSWSTDGYHYVSGSEPQGWEYHITATNFLKLQGQMNLHYLHFSLPKNYRPLAHEFESESFKQATKGSVTFGFPANFANLAKHRFATLAGRPCVVQESPRRGGPDQYICKLARLKDQVVEDWYAGVNELLREVKPLVDQAQQLLKEIEKVKETTPSENQR